MLFYPPIETDAGVVNLSPFFPIVLDVIERQEKRLSFTARHALAPVMRKDLIAELCASHSL